MIGVLLRDARMALGSLRRRVGFSAACILILAVGIGAVTMMYSALRGVVLRPMPYPDPDRLVWAWAVTDEGRDNTISALDYFDYRSECGAFSSLAAYLVWRPGRVLTGTQEPERLVSTSVSHNFFDTLGINPLRGRSFLADEEYVDGPAVVALSYRLWQRRFGGADSVNGTALTIDGVPHRVVAVMPSSFDFPSGVDLWLPMRKGGQRESGRGNNNFLVFGRLSEGATIAQAQAQMAAVAEDIAAGYPNVKGGWTVRLLPMHERFFAGVRPLMLALMGATTLLLLIACANLSALFVARVTARRSELAVRRSVGASSAAITRLLLCEGLVLALVGGAAGLGLAALGLRVLRAFGPADLPRIEALAIDGNVLLVSFLATVATAFLFGTAPASQGARADLTTDMRGERGSTGSRMSLRVRGLLVVFQLALSVVLLVGAGLLVRSAIRLQNVDPGFSVAHRLTLDVQMPEFRYTAAEERSRVFGELLERLRGFPGIEGAAATDQLPLFGGPWNRVHRADRAAETDRERIPAVRRIVTDDYFGTLGIPLRVGREFNPSDTFSGRPVVVISQSLADRMFPGESAVGKEMVLPWGDGIAMEIVGVAANVSDDGLALESRPVFYLPYHQYGVPAGLRVVVETSGEPAGMLPSVRSLVREVERDAPIFNEGTMARWLGESLATERFSTSLLLAFAIIALLLAATGIYGVMAYFVSERTREIGVRVAVGAGPGRIMRWILGKWAIMTGVGAVVGSIAAVGLARLISGLLFGTSPWDTVTYVSALVVLTSVGLLACVVPARRALLADATEALKS